MLHPVLIAFLRNVRSSAVMIGFCAFATKRGFNQAHQTTDTRYNTKASSRLKLRWMIKTWGMVVKDQSSPRKDWEKLVTMGRQSYKTGNDPLVLSMSRNCHHRLTRRTEAFGNVDFHAKSNVKPRRTHPLGNKWIGEWNEFYPSPGKCSKSLNHFCFHKYDSCITLPLRGEN